MLASLFPHDELEEHEPGGEGDEEKGRWRHFECNSFQVVLTLLVFLCPKRCAHMQVSSILVYVCCLCVCVTAGVSKR